MLDIDGFKRFNDNYGHLAGDALLTRIVDQLAEGLQPEDLIARIGGDEFIICIYNPQENESIQRTVRHVHKAVLEDSPEGLQLSTSMGVALSPKDGTTFEELYRKADVAMYCAKRRGGNGYLVYEENMVMPGPEEAEVRPETCQQHMLVRYNPQDKCFIYPPEMREVFRVSFEGCNLWDVLHEQHIAQPETVQRL
jgi:diguanylate cyclase (GGDEF)-like protein